MGNDNRLASGAATGIDSAIVFAGIAPHPPIMVPEVGGEAIGEVRGSIAAMAEFTQRLVDNDVETVVLISPHAPLESRAFVAYQTPQLHGDFANFRAPEARVEFPLNVELLETIVNTAADENYKVVGVENYDLDHGSAVPLYFLDRNGWQGRVVVLGYSFLSNEDHVKFGSCIRRAVDRLGRPVAFVASGDLSHRLKPEAPAGFSPAARLFDEQVVSALRENSPNQIAKIDQDLRRVAGECGYRSMLIALGATQGLPPACDVLHYEAPFGVGYLVAQLTSKAAANGKPELKVAALTDNTPVDLPAIARHAIETFVQSGKQTTPAQNASGLLAERAACFVSIKTKSGELRGCIGTVEPAKETLAEELVANAINAATRDPRFPPVAPNELAHLVYSVDILGALEPTTFEDLDPAKYGVVVEDESGFARGLLLPDIDGVDTAEKQVDIATRKAGIAPGTPLKLLRFRVDRFRE